MVVVVKAMRMILTMTMTVMLMIMITVMLMMMMAMTMMIMTKTVMTLMINLYRSRLPNCPSLAASKSLPAGWKILNSSSKILCLSKVYLVFDDVTSCDCFSYMLCWSDQQGKEYTEEKRIDYFHFYIALCTRAFV